MNLPCPPLCHGVAEGDGRRFRRSLRMAPTPTITQRSGGVFPVGRVRKIIIGDEVIPGHGSREMPIWGPIFHQIQEDRDYGEIRLQNITDYLKSIQK